eukprot:1316980-Karenia_brevis.AAC.1
MGSPCIRAECKISESTQKRSLTVCIRGGKRRREPAPSRNPQQRKGYKREVLQTDAKEEPASSSNRKAVESVSAAKRLSKGDLE